MSGSTLSHVATPVPTHRLSLREYLDLDLTDEHGNPCSTELVRGVVVVNPAPRPVHEFVKFSLGAMIVPALPVGLCVATSDWIVDADEPATVRVPDLAVVRMRELHEKRLTEPPLLAVEIVSERSSVERDLVAKHAEYAAAGCAHYWCVLPSRPELIRYRLEQGAYVEVGRHTGRRRVRVTDPFPVTIDLARLTV